MTVSTGLRPLALRPLPLGQIQPTGWLRRQLRIQADGLSGHLDEFWPDIARSGWIGGDAEGWERGPYWLDGVVPLAYLLDDEPLKAKIARWVDYILDHQQADGWLGPIDEGRSRTGHALDPWPRYPLLKALAQYQAATGDPRVVPAMLRFLRRLADLLATEPLRSWGHHRWADLVVVNHWLHDQTGADWLLDLAAVCRRQGFDWGAFFTDLPYRDRCTPEQCTRDSHVVNNAMGIKQPGVWFRQSGQAADRAAVTAAIATLDTYHGQVTGAFTGDEHLAGRNPSQGTELCAIVEYMYSLEVLIGILGDQPAELEQLADRLERLAFNCLPATCSGDMWLHQYDQQANQVVCRVADERVYTSNGPDANLFGLEPNFGCCTANLHQGWPKFAAHLWYRTPDDGLAAIAYAPAEVVTTVHGIPVRLTVETEYPFRQTVRITVHAAQPIAFPLRLRVPGWTTPDATLQIDGQAAVALPPGTLHLIDRVWNGRVTFDLTFPMPVRAVRGFNDSVAIRRGPLFYALRVGEDWRLVRGQHPQADWAIEPTTPWNYALDLDPAQPDRSLAFTEAPTGERPFSPDSAPVTVTIQGRRLPDWTLARNAAAPPPPSPVTSTEPLETLTLVPYGSTNLRVTEFPLLG